LGQGRPAKEIAMPLYVHLVKMTREGAGKIRDLATEYAKVRQYRESLGAKILCSVACFGEYDFVSVVEYPNEVAALKAAGYAASTGNVRLQTLPACQIEDFFKVMSELPR
jgi:uncharacterized protein with GYD domain